MLRAIGREPRLRRGASSPRSREAPGAEPRLDAAIADAADELPRRRRDVETRARAASSSAWPLALQASLLVRTPTAAVADAFCASRLGGDWGHAFGTLPAGTDFERIVERHRPQS